MGNKMVTKWVCFILLWGWNNVVYGQQVPSPDAFIQEKIISHNIPNTVVLWVSEGELIYQNISRNPNITGNDAMDAERSLFRVGSVSKPFTGLAALDMVREGLLELDTDIHNYFDTPRISYRCNRPITVRHLLTHTAGFDDFYINKSARNKEERGTLAENITSMLPEQWIHSGEISTYSNYGVALLGYVLEKAGGKPFHKVVEERVFLPLGMNRSTFEPGDEVYGDIVAGWFADSGTMRQAPFDYIRDVPAGQMLSTSNDMLRFMQMATRGDGLPPEQQALKEVWQEATSLQFTHHPRLVGGVGYLWSVTEYSGHNVVMHDGGYAGVASRLMFFPEHQQAFFLFTNNMNFAYISEITNEMIRRFLPPETAAAPAAVPWEEIQPVNLQDGLAVKDFAGYYRNTRYSRNSITKIAVLAGVMGVGGDMKIHTDGDYLAMRDHMGNIRRLVRTDTLLFSSIDDAYHLAFRKENGKITHVYTAGATALERIRMIESGTFQFPVMLVGIILFVLILLFYAAKLILHLITRKKIAFSSGQTLILGISAAYTLQLLLLFLGGLMMEPYELTTGFAYGVPGLFYVANLFPFAGALMTAILWIHIAKGNIGKAPFAVIASAYFLCLYYWNFVGWKF